MTAPAGPEPVPASAWSSTAVREARRRPVAVFGAATADNLPVALGLAALLLPGSTSRALSA